MIKLLALLILWSLPWRPDSLLVVAQLGITLGCEDKADMAGACGGYYDDEGDPKTVHLCDHPCLEQELTTIMIHESQHHMQLKYRMWRWPGGYAAFEEAVLHETNKLIYTNGVRRDVQTLMEQDRASDSLAYSELHAHLPVVLDLKIPPALRYWYPWFDLDWPPLSSGIAPSQENAPRPIPQ